MKKNSGMSTVRRRYEILLQHVTSLLEKQPNSKENLLYATDTVREWIFRNTPRASTEESTLCVIEPYPFSTTDILDQLRTTGTGYWCAGQASLLVCAYRDLGFQAATYAVGIEGGYTHAITAVNTGYGWFLQDPYSNVRFGLENDPDCNFFELSQGVEQGKQVRPVVSAGRLQPFIFCDQEKFNMTVVLPHGWHDWKGGKKIGLLHVSASQFFQHPDWPRSEPKMLTQPGQSPLTALFCNPLWLADPKHGFCEKPQNHPIWDQLLAPPARSD